MQKPFLKWAGGKSKLSSTIQPLLPLGDRLVEPFVGSGSIFINTNYKSYLLADVNEDLINLYLELQANGQSFIDYTKSFFTVDNNTQQEYYKLRETFNSTTDTRLKSALFVYLNRHCFNGLCRYNKSGGFNVPFGKYDKPYFPEAEMQAFHTKSSNAVFITNDFKSTLTSCISGDIVYCDPPYVPLSDTADFTAYASSGFTMADQEDLLLLSLSLRENGIPVLISNHATDWTLEKYKDAEITEIEVSRTISAKANERKKAKELLALFK